VDAAHYVGVCIRGDLTVNEVKLRGVLNANQAVIPPDEAVKTKLGLTVGYLGPRNLPTGVLKEVIADHSVKAMGKGVCGANRDGFHIINVYPSRDLTFNRYEDISTVVEGDVCPDCGKGKLAMRKGIEVGQVFKLGDKYAKPMNLTFLTEQNTESVMTMGCYGIGVGRTAAAAIEQNHDENGIIWPAAIAPYAVMLLCLDTGSEETMAVSKGIHDELEKNGVDVLFDDRPERPGVKFKDADLIGCPFRVTVGQRGLKEGIVEVKRRAEKAFVKVPKESCIKTILEVVKKEIRG